jgi:hypothetical protein
MNKNLFQITFYRDGNDRGYWKQKSYVERLEALELLRRIIFGYDPSTARLQRTITITQLKKS